MARGIRRALPGAEVVTIPMSDGGEGFVEALLLSIGGATTAVSVGGPDGRPLEASFAALADGRLAVETSAASGLQLVPNERRDALAATSRGTGELIAAILGRSGSGPRILCGLGGSAYTDGGTGAARAIGWRFLDAAGAELPEGGGWLERLAAIDGDQVDARIRGAEVVGVHDVDNPLLGARGAARVFAPQKGAGPRNVAVLERGLEVLAERIEADLGMAVGDIPAGGASGGLGAGLVAFFGASLAPGFDLVASITGLEEEIRRSDLVLTGEGALDASSLGGKTPAGVGRLALEAGVRCIALSGIVEVSEADLAGTGITLAVSLAERFGADAARRDAAAVLEEAVAGIT